MQRAYKNNTVPTGHIQQVGVCCDTSKWSQHSTGTEYCAQFTCISLLYTGRADLGLDILEKQVFSCIMAAINWLARLNL